MSNLMTVGSDELEALRARFAESRVECPRCGDVDDVWQRCRELDGA